MCTYHMPQTGKIIIYTAGVSNLYNLVYLQTSKRYNLQDFPKNQCIDWYKIILHLNHRLWSTRSAWWCLYLHSLCTPDVTDAGDVADCSVSFIGRQLSTLLLFDLGMRLKNKLKLACLQIKKTTNPASYAFLQHHGWFCGRCEVRKSIATAKSAAWIKAFLHSFRQSSCINRSVHWISHRGAALTAPGAYFN